MIVNQAKSPVVRLDIGGMGIDLLSRDLDLTQTISQRYQHFKPAAEDRFVADLKIDSTDRNTSLLPLEMSYKEGVLYYEAPGCQGQVDPFRKQGYLRMSTKKPLEEIDYYLRVVCALLAFESGGLLFHAAGVLHRGKAYLFFGYSGSGKTTVAHLSSPDEIINDDLLLIMPSVSGWQAHPTPFWNHYQAQPPTPTAQLAGLFRLVQDRSAYLEPMAYGFALAEIVSNIPVVSADPSRSQALLLRCQSILEAVPVFRLHFLKDASFWQVIEEAV